MRNTTIAELDVFRYDLRYRYGRYVMSGNRVVTTLPAIVVRVRTADGVVGYGEVCPLGPAYLPGFGGGVEAVLAELGPLLIGADAVRLGELNALMDRSLAGHGYAKSAVDIACWDVLGKVTGLPVAELIGGVRQERFPLYVAIPLESGEVMASYVTDRRAEGTHYFQLKLGGRPTEDAQRVAAVVAATDEHDVIVADANCGWKLQDATVAVRLLESMPRVHLEQPCATLEECLAVRRLTNLPFILDEVITDAATLIRAYQAQGMDAINLKISRVGGLTKALLIRDLATTLGLRLTIEDTWGGDLTTAAVSHLAASTAPESLFMVSFMNDWTDGHIGGYQPRSEYGFGAAPVASGLGLEIDENLLGDPILAFSGGTSASLV